MSCVRERSHARVQLSQISPSVTFVAEGDVLNLLLIQLVIVMDPSGLSYAQRVIEHNFEPEASAFQ